MDVDLFKSKYRIDESGCWIWIAGCVDGYGRFHIDRKPIQAHRASYLLNKGHIPPGLLVCHSCDKPKCVNPEHLFLGSNRENSADMVSKKRQAKGEKHGMHKLTEQQAIAIKASAGTQLEVSKRFGVDRSLVGYIRRGVVWSHL